MKKFLYSFKYAFNGIAYAFNTQLNFKVHLMATVLAMCLGFFFQISCGEWLWIGCAIAMVVVAELFNTAIEMMVDLISPDRNPKAGAIKDVAAAAVLITAIFALIVGLSIFTPKIFQYVA